MRLSYIIGILVLCYTSANAQGWYPSGARSMSMANASVTLEDVWAVQNNPGAIAAVDQMTVGISYENRFLLKELQSQGIAYAQPLKTGVISVGGSMYGYRNFRDYKAGLGYGLKLAEHFYAGVQINLHGLQLAEYYGSKNSMSGEAGILYYLTDNWHIGASVFNLGRAKLSDFEDDRLSTIMRFGTSYYFSDKVLVTLETEKNLDYPLRVKSGVEYEIAKNFRIRGGVAGAPIELSFGMEYGLKSLQVALGSSYHQVLGWSPHFSLTFQAVKDEK